MQALRLVCLLLLALCLVKASQEHSTGKKYTDDVVLTPFGYYPASCVHAAPKGAHIKGGHSDKTLPLQILHPDGTTNQFPRCSQTFDASFLNELKQSKAKRGQGNGWQVYALEKIGSNVTSLLGQWTVPNAPDSYDEQTIFLFTGLQNINWIPPDPSPGQPFDIIQPVLQYGPSAAGGYDQWAIASWYVTLTDDVVFSPLTTVQTGDVIFGNMTKTGAQEWYINTVDVTQNVKTDMTISRPILKEQPWIYVTLEAYGIYSCDLFPSDSVAFTSLKLFEAGVLSIPQWVTGDKSPFCASSVTVESPGAVTISFK